jgi:hypothetical protein
MNDRVLRPLTEMVDEPGSNLPSAVPTAKRLVPGYLFTPFGWAGQKLAAMPGPPEAGLLAQLFELDESACILLLLLWHTSIAR